MRITKNYCHYWIHHPHFVLSMRFHQNWYICHSLSKTSKKTWPNRWQVPNWQVSILTGVKNYKKLLSPLTSSPLICAEYKISSKLKHLLLFLQNYGLKDDTCQHWQVSRITKNYCHQLIQHLQIVHYVKFRGKWLTSFPVPRSPF